MALHKQRTQLRCAFRSGRHGGQSLKCIGWLESLRSGLCAIDTIKQTAAIRGRGRATAAMYSCAIRSSCTSRCVIAEAGSLCLAHAPLGFLQGPDKEEGAQLWGISLEDGCHVIGSNCHGSEGGLRHCIGILCAIGVPSTCPHDTQDWKAFCSHPGWV